MALLDELRNGKKKPGRPPLEYGNDIPPHPLKQFFDGLGITQAAISKELNINPSLLSRYLNGRLAVPVGDERKLQDLAHRLRAEMKKSG